MSRCNGGAAAEASEASEDVCNIYIYIYRLLGAYLSLSSALSDSQHNAYMLWFGSWDIMVATTHNMVTDPTL